MSKLVVRIILFLLAFMIVFSTVYSVFAAELDEDVMTAASIMLIDADTGAVLYEKNADAQRAPASTTKLMTAVLALENLELDQVITVPPEAQNSGSSMGLVPGQLVSTETLLYGLMLCSGNDAAVTLAIATSGKVSAFATKMNAKAVELGMTNSHFVTASGLDAEGHYVTVRDMAKLARYAYQNELLREIMLTKKKTMYTVDKAVSFPMENTNLLINTPTLNGAGEPYTGPVYLYEYANGMKTGSTYNANGCLVASAQKNGQNLIALVFGDDSDGENDRWKIATALFEYGFSEFKNYSFADLLGGNIEQDVVGGPIINGEALKLQCIPVTEEGSSIITLSASIDPAAITYQVTPSSTGLSAPIREGAEVGSIDIFYEGQLLVSTKLVAEEAMMTAEEYAKLSGEQAESSGLLNQDTEKRKNIRKYVWIWLLLPVLIIAAVVWFWTYANRYSHRRHRPSGGIAPSAIRNASSRSPRLRRREEVQTVHSHVAQRPVRRSGQVRPNTRSSAPSTRGVHRRTERETSVTRTGRQTHRRSRTR